MYKIHRQNIVSHGDTQHLKVRGPAAVGRSSITMRAAINGRLEKAEYHGYAGLRIVLLIKDNGEQ